MQIANVTLSAAPEGGCRSSVTDQYPVWKMIIPDSVNIPGSPMVTVGNVGEPWVCFGIQGFSAVTVTSAGPGGAAAPALAIDPTHASVPVTAVSVDDPSEHLGGAGTRVAAY